MRFFDFRHKKLSFSRKIWHLVACDFGVRWRKMGWKARKSGFYVGLGVKFFEKINNFYVENQKIALSRKLHELWLRYWRKRNWTFWKYFHFSSQILSKNWPISRKIWHLTPYKNMVFGLFSSFYARWAQNHMPLGVKFFEKTAKIASVQRKIASQP